MPIFMKYDGVDGSVTSTGYVKAILLDHCEWGIDRATETVGRDTKHLRATCRFVKIVKGTDPASVGLIEELVRNAQQRSVAIHWTRTNKTGDLETFLKLELGDVRVVNYQLEGGGEALPRDAFQLSYTRFEIKAWEWKNDRLGSSRSSSYDVQIGS